MSGRNTTLIVLAIVAIGLSYFKYRFAEPLAPSPSPVASSVAKASSIPIATWSEFSTPYFSLKHPPEASSSALASGIDYEEWRVNYMGNLQIESGRTQTELWDGYAITFTRFEVIGDDPVDNQLESDRRGTVESCNEEAVSEPVISTLGNIQTKSFQGSCLGTYTNHYFLVGDALYRVSILIERPVDQTQNYQETVSQILSTLEIK